MKAFYIIHPNGTDEERETFFKLRQQNYLIIRRLYLTKKISLEDRNELMVLLHQADTEELREIYPHIKEIDEQGVRIVELRAKIKPKERPVPHRKARVVATVTETTKLRDFWVGKGKRIIAKRYKKGEIDEELKAKLYEEGNTLYNPNLAEEWCLRVLQKQYTVTALKGA